MPQGVLFSDYLRGLEQVTGLEFWALLPSWPRPCPGGLGSILEVGGENPTAPGHLSRQAEPWGGCYPVLPAQVPQPLWDQHPNCVTPFIQNVQNG